MSDGMLDIVLLIIVLAIVIGVSFSLIIPLTNTDSMGYNETLRDKSVVNDVRDGSVAETDIEPKKKLYRPHEVILLLHVQDEKMPQPRALRVGNNSIVPVTSTYKLEVIELGRDIWRQLPIQDSYSEQKFLDGKVGYDIYFEYDASYYNEEYGRYGQFGVFQIDWVEKD